MTPRFIKLLFISSSLALGISVVAQGDTAIWQARLGNTTLSNSDSSRKEALRLPIEINPLGRRELGLCRNGRFVLVLEQAGAVIGMDGTGNARVTGRWVIVRAGATIASLELSPSTMSSSGALLAAELQRFSVMSKGASV